MAFVKRCCARRLRQHRLLPETGIPSSAPRVSNCAAPWYANRTRVPPVVLLAPGPQAVRAGQGKGNAIATTMRTDPRYTVHAPRWRPGIPATPAFDVQIANARAARRRPAPNGSVFQRTQSVLPPSLAAPEAIHSDAPGPSRWQPLPGAWPSHSQRPAAVDLQQEVARTARLQLAILLALESFCK